MSMATRMKRLLNLYSNLRHFTATAKLCYPGGDRDRPLRGSGDRPDLSGGTSRRRDRPPFSDDDNYRRKTSRAAPKPSAPNQNQNDKPRCLRRNEQPFSNQSPYIHDNLQDCPTPIAKQGEAFLKKFKLAAFADKQTSTDTQPHPSSTTVNNPTPPQDADEIFKTIKEKGLIPNAVAMLDGLCKDGLVQDAMKLFGLMREKGTIPQVVIYTAVVDAFCKGHKFDDAKRIFRKMQKNAITPNAFSYTVLIQGLCAGRRFDNAVDFSLEMLEAGHSPNVATFTALIDGFCNDKGVEEAEKIIKRLRVKGFFVNDKAVKEHLDKKGPFSPLVWEAIFGKKESQRLF